MKTIIALLLCLLPALVFADSQPAICPHNSFACLKQNLDDFYTADYDRFYKVYRRAFGKAMRCHDDKAVASYLGIFSAPHDSAEVGESMQQDTEALLLLKPKCFFKGLSLLTPEQQANFIGGYHLFSRPNHVMALLQKYMKAGKYKKLAAQIYNANLGAYDSYGKGDEDAPMSDLRQQFKQYMTKAPAR